MMVFADQVKTAHRVIKKKRSTDFGLYKQMKTSHLQIMQQNW